MSTHQSHNIPWNILVDNIKWRAKPGGTEYDWWPAQQPGEEQAIRHFARKVASAITAFSETERKKYPSLVQLDEEALFPDALLDKPEVWDPPCVLKKEHQSLTWWRERARAGWTSSHGDEANAIKKLYALDCVDVLLFLAQHDELQLAGLEWITYSHFFQYGTRRVRTNALSAYLLVNMHAALNMMGSTFRPSLTFKRVHRHVTESTDYDTHQEIHREFFRDNEELQKTERLAPYLKRLFRILYVWDFVAKEYGKPVDWEVEVLDCLRWFLRFQIAVEREHIA